MRAQRRIAVGTEQDQIECRDVRKRVLGVNHRGHGAGLVLANGALEELVGGVRDESVDRLEPDTATTKFRVAELPDERLGQADRIVTVAHIVPT